MIEEFFSKPVLVIGCGNVLLGDDGFGPAVVERLYESRRIPDDVFVLDAGTAVRDLLFDLLLHPGKPKHVYIVDAVANSSRRPGEIFEIDLHEIEARKVNDFSLHQSPSVNLLSELRDSAGVEVTVLAVQAESIPDAVSPGISDAVRAAVPRACDWLLGHIEGMR